MKLLLISLLLIVFEIANPLYSQSKISDNRNGLEYYLDAACKNSPALKENSNSIKISEIDKSLVESENLLPQISLTSNYLFTPYFNNNGKLVTTDPGENAYGYDVSLFNGGLYSAQINVEQNIFNGSAVDAFRNQSDIKINSTRHFTDVLKHSIQKDVTEQYLTALEAQKLYLLSKEIADTIQKQLDLTESLMKSGVVKQSDYLLLKIETENQKLAAEQGYVDFVKNISELNTLCGLKDSSSVLLSNADLKFDNTLSISRFLKQYTFDSLMVQNQQSIFETKYSPKVNLFFNTGLNAVDLENIEHKFGLSAGINFTLPIYDGSQKSLTRQQTEISLKTIEAYKENQKIQVSNKIKNANEEILFFRKNLKSISDQVQTYNTVMAFARMELMKGQRSMVEYITLIKSFLDLKKNYVSAEIDCLKAINQYNYWNW